MLILGNRKQQEILKEFFAKASKDKDFYFPFLILEGPAHIGKTTLVQKLVKDFLGNYFLTDYIELLDFSEKLWKKHQIKVDSEDEIKINWETFIDLGARQVQDFLLKSWFSGYKIVFIENIDRMTIAAANAMLKIFEEPLPGRLIIWTTTSKEKLLDTLTSRAFIMRFIVPVDEDWKNIKDFLKNDKIEIFNQYKNVIFSLSQMRPGIVFSILENWDTIASEIKEMYEIFEKFINIYEKNLDLWEKYSVLKQIVENNWFEKWINFMIYYFDKKWDFKEIKKILFLKQKKDAHLNLDNLIFEYSL